MSNKSGISPVEYKVLIKQDVVEEKTSGGIILAAETKNREQMAQSKATIIAVGGNAFEDWIGTVPKRGERVLTAQFAGVKADGADGEEYRLINDKDITAVIEGM
jgi:chaperonin GroES